MHTVKAEKEAAAQEQVKAQKDREDRQETLSRERGMAEVMWVGHARTVEAFAIGFNPLYLENRKALDKAPAKESTESPTS